MKENKNITFYNSVDKNIIKRASAIQLLICDVDGVLSNGLIYMDSKGEEFQSFHVHDGYGIRCLLEKNIEVAIISGRISKIVVHRAATLGINRLYQGQLDKTIAFKKLLTDLTIEPHQVGYIGDDLIDLTVMKQVGLAVAVSNAHPFLITQAHYVTHRAGGQGAVREICDLILCSQNKL